MALTQQKPLALALALVLASVGRVEATRVCACMGHGDAAGAVCVTVMGLKHQPGPLLWAF